ncbi:hypothetical protein GMMP1_500021 [Candidatus Magnetomoraceae bacterium gMMP-1]
MHGNKIIGQSSLFQDILDKAYKYATKSTSPIMLTGETGTGKGMIAKYIYENSNRKNCPFLVQNCSAIPEALMESELFGYKKGAFTGAEQDKIGLFGALNRGTIFLDDIDTMSINLQACLLRVVENKEFRPIGETSVKNVDVRIISATNKNIKEMLEKQKFRQDLYYRLNVHQLHLPPLRERKEDIQLLLEHFIKKEILKMNIPSKKINPDTMELLKSYHWPGNIRELENLIKALLVDIDGEFITSQHLPVDFIKKTVSHKSDNTVTSYPEKKEYLHAIVFNNNSYAEVEKNYIYFLLRKNKWNRTQAAKDAGINRSTFVSRMKRLGVK